ncbi:MAG: hypothetical protein ACFB10_21135 [Salibacteraceae bacterium]
MHIPTRRNRNIGTSKQGHGQHNALSIPQPADTLQSFYERLDNYEKESRTINGHEFVFVTEATRTTSKHACTIDDIEQIIRHIPAHDYGELQLVVLRQPKRKEEILSSVWGRLIYSYAFEGDYFPAIIIEAIDYSKSLKWTKKLSPDDRKELECLQKDGHPIQEGKRHYTAEHQLENVRNTQLYRTLPHEFGHYVHYLEAVKRPGTEDEAFEAWEAREAAYFQLPTAEKEKFAHQYADDIIQALKAKGVVPFDRME